jgi:transposase
MTYSADDKARIIKHLKARNSIRKTAAKFGVNQHIMTKWWYRYRKANGLQIMLRGHKSIDPTKVDKYIRENPDAPLVEIAKELGCSITGLTYTIEIHDIPYVHKQPMKLNREELIKYRKKHPNATYTDIGRKYNCSPQAVVLAFKRYGIPYTKQVYPAVDIEELKKYIKENPDASYTKISAKFKRSPAGVRLLIKRHKIPYISKLYRNKKLDPDLVEKYIKENPDATYKEIGKKFNCTWSSVRTLVKKHNIPYIRKSPPGRTPRSIKPEANKS